MDRCAGPFQRRERALVREGRTNDRWVEDVCGIGALGLQAVAQFGDADADVRAQLLVRPDEVRLGLVPGKIVNFCADSLQNIHSEGHTTGKASAPREDPSRGMAAIVFVAVAVAIGAAMYAYTLFKRYAQERHEHRRVVALFSRYMPAPVVEDLLARKDPRLLEAREYYATLLHVRIRNFALFSEPLTPEETLRYLNEFYTIVGQAVGRHRGFIESLRADTVVAVFGVLIDERFQEERALRAALDIMRVVAAMEARWREQRRKPFTIGIGVNSGKVVAGDSGYKDRREFAVIGNPAQVAAQLEAASEELNASIVASEATYTAVRDLFVGIPTSSLPLKGLRRLQNAYIVRGLSRRGPDERSLTLPSQRSFQTTVVHAYGEGEPPPAEGHVYLAPEVAAEERAVVDERLTDTTPALFSRFSRYDDEAPALPHAPPVAGMYEDDQGPPIELPP